MELDLFRTFVAVAEARSFTRAAHAIHSRQPTLSRQISRLEDEVGMRLLERYGHHVECTVAGELLLPLARAIIARTDEALGLLREHAGGGPGAVRFGAIPSVMSHLLTPVLVSFLSTYPSVSVELNEKDDVQLEQAVIGGELDCAVINPWGSTRTASRHLVTEEVLLLVPSNHRFATLPAVPWRMLERESTLLPPTTSNMSNVYVDALRVAGVTLRSSYRADCPELAKALVRKGLGVAPMPKMLCSPGTLEGLATVPFDKPLYRDLVLIYSRERPLTLGARMLMNHIRAMVVSGRRHTVSAGTASARRSVGSSALKAFDDKVEELVASLMRPAKVAFNKATLASPRAAGGKKVLYLPLMMASSMKQVSAQQRRAAEVLAWEFRMIDPDGDPNKIGTALATALSEKVDGVICHTIDAKTVLEPLRTLKASGIPVIGFAAENQEGLYVCEGTPGPDGLAQEAYWAIAAGYVFRGGARGVPIRIIRLDQPGVEIVEGRNRGFEEFLAEAKDAGADIEVLAKVDYTPAEQTTALPARIVRAVRQNALYNVMWSSVDDGLAVARSALASAHLYDTSKVWCAVDCQPATFAEIHAGGAIKGTIGSPNSWCSWAMMNDLNRIFTGLPPLGGKGYGYPTMLVTKDNTAPPKPGAQVPWDTYMQAQTQAGFTKIWTGA